MRGGGGGSNERDREEVLYTVGARNGSVARKVLRGGRRFGDFFFPEHTQKPLSRCFVDSLENTRIRSGLRPLNSSRSYVFLNTEEESGRCPFLELRKQRGQLWSVFFRYVF